MRKLSNLDASFIYLESAQTPMQVGGLYVFAADSSAPPLTVDAWREQIGARLHVCRTLRQRLVRVPLDLDHPYWIEDPDFRLDNHLSQATLPAPGGWQELMRLAEQHFSRPLNQDRPLWEMVLISSLQQVENLPPGSWALLVKVHHAAADGVSGAGLVRALLEPNPEPQQTPWQPEPLPGRATLLGRTALATLSTPLTLARLAGRVGLGAVKALQARRTAALPSLPFTAPYTRFNAAVTAQRRLRGLVLALERIKALKNAIPGSTINDIMLAVCAGGLRGYLQAHGELPAEPLIAAVPIATRSNAQWQSMGNQVSALLIALATDEADPLQRLARIRAETACAKAYSEVLRYDQTTALIPAPAGTLVGPLYTRLLKGQWLKPFFNLFITNVPGDRQPLYLGTARMQYYLGTAPIYNGLGLILVITSYADTLSLSVTSCPTILPDPDALVQHLSTALAELEAVLATAPG